ncbi:MAG: hypothetical protein LUD47_01150 [Clostridia bacterium]|nr:hypothetical protein [Clostridia bacterium]
MIDEEKVKKAAGEFCGNPYFKKMYDDAPTETSGRHTALSFYYSEYASELKADMDKMDEYKNEREALEEKTGLADWKYLLKYCPNRPLKPVCRKKVEGLENDGGKL